MIKVRAAARRWFWILIIGTVAGATIGGMSTALQGESTELHEATSIVLFDVNRSSSATQQAAQQAGLRLRRGEVPERAAELLEREDPSRLVKSITVEVERDSLSLFIRAVDEDPDEASDIAEAFVAAFLESSNQRELSALDDRIGVLEQQLETAERRLADFDAANPFVGALTDPRVPLVQQRSALVEDLTTATQLLDETRQQRDTTTGPYSPLGSPTVTAVSNGVVSLPDEPKVRMALLGIIGLLMSAMLIALLERLNPRIDTKEEAEATTQLPVLTMVPFVGRRHRSSGPATSAAHFGGHHAEAYNRLRSTLQFIAGRTPDANANGNGSGQDGQDQTSAGRPRSFLVVSSSPGEGKTSTVEFTALALAEADVPTIAINADTRRPTLHRQLGLELSPGLADMAALTVDRPTVDDVAQPGPVDGLWVLSSGEPGVLTNELVERIREVIADSTARGATVLIDSSPLLAASDAMELLPLVDHVLFVVRTGRTTRKEALDGLESLRLRDAPLLGCVCVGSPGARRRYPYYQSYYFNGPDRGKPPALDPTPGGAAETVATIGFGPSSAETEPTDTGPFTQGTVAPGSGHDDTVIGVEPR